MVDKAAEIDISGKYRARPRNDKVNLITYTDFHSATYFHSSTGIVPQILGG